MFHVTKQTRVYDGEPYCGYSSNNVPMEFDSLEKAIEATKWLQFINPVGWNVFDSVTGKCVHGEDMFQ